MRSYKNNRLFTLNNPLAPRVCPELAKEIGLNESILLLQLEFWMVTEGQENDDGFTWLRKTVREIQSEFVYWGTGTVGRILESLVSKGLVVGGNLDEGPGKSGRWLRFNFDRLTLLKSIRVLSHDGTTVVPKTGDSVPTRDNRPYKQEEEHIPLAAGFDQSRSEKIRDRKRPRALGNGHDKRPERVPLAKQFKLAGWVFKQIETNWPEIDVEAARLGWMGKRISSGAVSADWDADFVGYCASIRMNSNARRNQFQQPEGEF